MATQKDVFITATYYAKPRNRAQTFRVGYMKNDDNVQHDEAIDITVGLKNKDLATAKIILNVSKQVITKNSFGGDKTFHELFSYFYMNNRDQIGQALAQAGITVTQPTPPVTEETGPVTVEDEATTVIQPEAITETTA